MGDETSDLEAVMGFSGFGELFYGVTGLCASLKLLFVCSALQGLGGNPP